MTYEISQIQEQKRKKDRWNLYTEEGFLLSLSQETLYKSKIKVGTLIDQETLDRLKEEDTYLYAKELSADYLSYAPRAKKQLLDHLLQKGIDQTSAERAVSLMEEYGYIDDLAYTKEFVRIYSQRWGPRAIEQKLVAKGVPMEVARRAIEEENPAIKEQTARDLFRKLQAKYAQLPAPKARQKLYQAMLRKGFSYDDISALWSAEEEDV